MGWRINMMIINPSQMQIIIFFPNEHCDLFLNFSSNYGDWKSSKNWILVLFYFLNIYVASGSKRLPVNCYVHDLEEEEGKIKYCRKQRVHPVHTTRACVILHRQTALSPAWLLESPLLVREASLEAIIFKPVNCFNLGLRESETALGELAPTLVPW